MRFNDLVAARLIDQSEVFRHRARVHINVGQSQPFFDKAPAYVDQRQCDPAAL